MSYLARLCWNSHSIIRVTALSAVLDVPERQRVLSSSLHLFCLSFAVGRNLSTLKLSLLPVSESLGETALATGVMQGNINV